MIRDLLRAEHVPRGWRAVLGAVALVVAAAIWLPALQIFFRPAAGEFRAPGGISPVARALAARHLELWTRPDLRERELARMRRSNAEWDFMGRTFLVLALANMGLRAPSEAPRHLEVIDRIIEETVRLEKERGFRHFLMDYARRGAFRSGIDRSLFVDGEIALMLGARRLVEERPDYRPLLEERVEAMLASMGRSPVIPVLDVSPGSSGMAFLGAAAFGDETFLSDLAATLDFAAFPSREGDGLRYAASNQVGDAVLLYAAVMGPLWGKVEDESRR